LFFLTTFAISWFIRELIIALRLPFGGTGTLLEGFAIPGPCVAALAVTARRSGRAGVKKRYVTIAGTDALRWACAVVATDLSLPAVIHCAGENG
jgi:hypothetical protein